MIEIVQIIVVAIVSIIFGMLWYSPAVCGKPWMKMTKVKMKKGSKPGFGTMISAFIISVVMFGVLNFFIGLFAITQILGGMTLAATFWVGFMAPKELSPVLWQKKPAKLFLINGAHDLIMMLIASIIFVIW